MKSYFNTDIDILNSPQCPLLKIIGIIEYHFMGLLNIQQASVALRVARTHHFYDRLSKAAVCKHSCVASIIWNSPWPVY